MAEVNFLRGGNIAGPAVVAATPAPAVGMLGAIAADVGQVVRAVENIPVVRVIETDIEKAAHFVHTELSSLAKKCEASPEYQFGLQSVHKMKAYVQGVYARAKTEGHRITEELHSIFVGGLKSFFVNTEHSIHQFAVEAVTKFDDWVFGGVKAELDLVDARDP